MIKLLILINVAAFVAEVFAGTRCYEPLRSGHSAYLAAAWWEDSCRGSR